MQNSWIKTREDSRVDEAAKRPFSHGDAETGKTASTGDSDKWKLELVSGASALPLRIPPACSLCPSPSGLSHPSCPLSHLPTPAFNPPLTRSVVSVTEFFLS